MVGPLDATHWAGSDLDRLFDAHEYTCGAGDGHALVAVVIRGERLRLLRLRMPGCWSGYSVVELFGSTEPHIYGWHTADELLTAIDAVIPLPSPATVERRQLRAAIAAGLQPALPLEEA